MLRSNQRNSCGGVKWSPDRCWTLRHNMLWYSDLTVNAFMPTAWRSITSVLVWKTGNSLLVAPNTFILMTRGGSTFFLVTLSLVPLLTSWSCDCVRVMEVIACFWLVTTHCTTKKGRLRVG